MGKILIIAEKPSVAREISAALGGFKKTEEWQESSSAVISSGIGHLVEIYSPEAMESGKDLGTLPIIPKRFELKAIERTKKQFNLLSKLMRRSDIDSIVNACDAGREGELIFRLIYELAGCHKPIQRMWLQSMTADSIRSAYQKMKAGKDYEALSDAAKCRSEADWLIGINGSRGITRLKERQVQKYESMSVGRVQTPTLAIIVNREWEITNFIPKEYWEVHGRFSGKAGSYIGKWIYSKQLSDENNEDADAGSKIWDKALAEEILARCTGVDPSSVHDESKIKKTSPPKLFDLTTLQREANKKFKLSAKQTLDIAQSLYEKHKVTTYPRTDSTALPEDYFESTKEILSSFKGSPYADFAASVLTNGWVKQDKRIFDDTKISDHFAIIPTGIQPAGLDAGEAKVFDMIVRRFMAAFYPPAEYSMTTRTTLVSGETFKTSGRILIKSGWLEVYGQQNQTQDDQPALCLVEEGESIKNDELQIKTLQTKPPLRFTEGTLLAAMEGAGKLINDEELKDAMKDHGLGTPATRAAIIEGLLNAKDTKGNQKTAYVLREGKEQYLVPTEKGAGLIEFLNDNAIDFLTSPKMTGEWEQKLKQIESGEYQRKQFMEDIANLTTSMIEVIRHKADHLPVMENKKISSPCRVCGSDIVSKPKRYECEAGCGFALWKEVAGHTLSEAEAATLINTGFIKNIDGFVSKKNKKFSAGLRINSDNKSEFVFAEGNGLRNESEANPIGIPCPKCGSDILKKGGKYPQYACSKCDFMLWKTIAGKELSDDEAKRLIEEGEHPEMQGFISSRTNKKFSAGLRMSSDKSKVTFIFNN